MRVRFVKGLIHLGLGIGMSISLTLGISYLLELQSSYLQIVISICLLQCLYMIIFCNVKVYIVCVSFLSIGGSIVYLVLQKKWEDGLKWLHAYFKQNAFEILLMSSIVLIVYFLTCKYFKKSMLIGMGVILYSSLIFRDVQVQSLEVGLLLLMSLLYCFYDYFLKLTRQEEGTKELSVSYFKMCIYLCTLTLGLAFVAAYRVPIQFKVLHRILDKKEVAKAKYSYSEYYPYSGRLGGDIVLSNEEVLEVMTAGTSYLKADSKSIYTGSYWTNVIKESTVMEMSTYEIQDTVEMLKGMSLLTKADKEKLYKEQIFIFTFKDLMTQSLFIPIKSDNMAVAQGITKVYKKNRDTLLLGQAYGKGFTYSMHAYIPEYNTPEFKEALNRSKRGLYAACLENGNTGELSREELEKWRLRAEEIYITFTKLPKTLPERVKTLAYEITKDYASDYDKARALESYLSTHYSYSLSPGEPTKGRDFVDEFLFDKKKGYCTYFATSMAVLARCIGLPSRYVEGYAMPVAYKEGMRTDTITNRQAHAWTEIYFEGFGWMTFEPTARYQSSFRSNPLGTEDSYYRPPVVDHIEDMMDDEKSILKKQDKGLYTSIKKIVALMGIGTFGIVMLVICHRNRHTKKLLPSLYIIQYYEKACNHLSKKGFKLQKGETELTFARRVDEILGRGLEKRVSFVEMTQLYLMARYSQEEIGEDKKQEMYRGYTSLRKAVKRKLL